MALRIGPSHTPRIPKSEPKRIPAKPGKPGKPAVPAKPTHKPGGKPTRPLE